VKEAIVGDGEARKRYVIAFNPKEAERDRFKRESIIETLEERLTNLKQLPHEAHHKEACRLRSHGTYGKYIRQLKDGTLKLNKQAVRDAVKYDGKYLIRTSDDTLSPEDIVLGYKQLLDVEDAFRTLKSTLHLRPMYHRLEERIRSHVLISWLSLLLVRIIEVETRSTWGQLRKEMNRLHLGCFLRKTETCINAPGSLQNSSKPLRLWEWSYLQGSLISTLNPRYTPIHTLSVSKWP
jgi:transposase